LRSSHRRVRRTVTSAPERVLTAVWYLPRCRVTLRRSMASATLAVHRARRDETVIGRIPWASFGFDMPVARPPHIQSACSEWMLFAVVRAISIARVPELV
jgi:hypothetical protein